MALTTNQIITLARNKLLEQPTEIISEDTILIYANLTYQDLIKRTFTNDKILSASITFTNGIGTLPTLFGTMYGSAMDSGNNQFEEVKPITEAGKSSLCKCGKEAKQIIVPAGYAPWKSFYCNTQGRQFDTRESYQHYCHSKGLEGITAREYKEISQQAEYMAKCEKEGREQKKIEARG